MAGNGVCESRDQLVRRARAGQTALRSGASRECRSRAAEPVPDLIGVGTEAVEAQQHDQGGKALSVCRDCGFEKNQ